MSTESPWSSKSERPVTLHHSRHAWLTYEAFYGLKDKPFSLSSDPAFFYNSRSHATAYDELLSGIRRRESLSVVTGDIGTGKTTLCRTVLKDLDRQTFSAFVPDPFATREDLLKVVLADFGVVSAEDLATGRLRGASRTELSFLLYEFLSTLSPLQAFAVVFIDEAQNLSLPLLEEIRILSDSDGRERQLQVVLVGQLELRDKLRLPEMRQVAQRVSVRCGLEPLDRDGVSGYISHRLHVAGGSPDRVRFSHEVIDAVYKTSGGVPRLINRLCDRALHYGHLRRVAVIDEAAFALARDEMEPSVAGEAPATPRGPTVGPLDSDDTSWFEEFDAQVTKTEPAVALFGTRAPVGSSEPDDHRTRTVVPLTRMEMLQRRWFRRFKIGVLLLALPGIGGYGMTVVLSNLAEPVTLPAVSRPAPPAMPMPLVIPPVPDDDAIPPAQDVPPSY